MRGVSVLRFKNPRASARAYVTPAAHARTHKRCGLVETIMAWRLTRSSSTNGSPLVHPCAVGRHLPGRQPMRSQTTSRYHLR